MSRDQVGIDMGRKKAQFDKSEIEMNCSVCFFDTINLPVAGEYLVRGQISRTRFSSDSGIFEPNKDGTMELII